MNNHVETTKGISITQKEELLFLINNLESMAFACGIETAEGSVNERLISLKRSISSYRRELYDFINSLCTEGGEK